MAVVINEFEVLPVAQTAPRKEAGAAANDASQEKIEPCAVAVALQTLDAQALRSWAH